MSGLRVLVLGVGDAFSACYYSSCLALEADGVWLLIDCPHPIRKIVREAAVTAEVPLEIDQFAGLALTHLHADHSSGLETLGFFGRFVLGKSVPLLVHPDVSARLWDGHLAAGMEEAYQGNGQPPVRRRLEDFFQILPLTETEPVALGPFSILCHKTIHTVPTTALLIRAGGRCLGYSADTAFDPSLITWLGQADLVIHEVNPGLLHTPYEDLAALPAERRRQMRVIHYPDSFDLAHSAIEPLRQGQLLSV